MKKAILAAALLLIIPAWGRAQYADHGSRTEGYLFVGPIVSNAPSVISPTSFLHLAPGEVLAPDFFSLANLGLIGGFGGDFLVYGGLGGGGELAYAAPAGALLGQNGLGIGSFDASYRFRRGTRLEPFLVGGYSIYFGNPDVNRNGFNFGCGLNLWPFQHVALRIEVRDQGNVNYFHSLMTNFVAFRLGLAFR